jgi:uncharacterized protein YjbI with pentapeptide repeats
MFPGSTFQELLLQLSRAHGVIFYGRALQMLVFHGPMLHNLTFHGLTLQGLMFHGLMFHGLTLQDLTLQGLALQDLTLQDLRCQVSMFHNLIFIKPTRSATLHKSPPRRALYRGQIFHWWNRSRARCRRRRPLQLPRTRRQAQARVLLGTAWRKAPERCLLPSHR